MAAAVQHMVKLGTHSRALEKAEDQDLSFTKGALVFETTGCMGKETQRWSIVEIVEMDAEQRIPGATQCRQELDHTWLYPMY